MEDVNGITSHTPLDTVFELIAKGMEVRTEKLPLLGYVPSYKPKSPKPKPKVLRDEKNWNALLQDVWDYMSQPRNKKTVKAFSIRISVLGGGDGQEAESSKKKQKEKVRKT